MTPQPTAATSLSTPASNSPAAMMMLGGNQQQLNYSSPNPYVQAGNSLNPNTPGFSQPPNMSATSLNYTTPDQNGLVTGDGKVPGYTPPNSTPPPAPNNPAQGNRPASWASDYNPSSGGFIWRDGTIHGTGEPSQGSPTLANGAPNPQYFPGGPSTDVWGNAIGSKTYGQAAGQTQNTQAAQSPFGANPYQSNPGYGGPAGQGGYNPMWFANPQTAALVSQMFPGAKVVQQNAITNAPGSPIQQNQPNQMVLLPNGQLINPGFIASLYGHGWDQNTIMQKISEEAGGLAPQALAPGTQPQVQGNAPTVPGLFQGAQLPSPGQAASAGQTPGQGQGQGQGDNSQISALLQALSGGQQNQGQQDPLSAYLAQALGGSGGLFGSAGQSMLSNNNPSMSMIAGLLNLLSQNQSQGPAPGVFNPLFWNSGNQAPQNSFYPSFF